MRTVTIILYLTWIAIVLYPLQLVFGNDDSLKILFGGDTSFGESYQEEYAAKGRGNILVAHGYDHSIDKLSDLLIDVDYAVLNLETPLTAIKTSPLKGKDYIHWSDPIKATAALKKHRVSAVSLANNHTLDIGSDGLADTVTALREHGIEVFGAGANLEAAEKALVKTFDVAGLPFHIAVIGVFEFRPSYERYGFYADSDRPGANAIDFDRLRRQIANLRADTPGIYIVIFPHWGDNYVWRSEDQQEAARKMIDAGADLIVGHGAHRLQEIEQYRGRWIAYSVGNFMFNAAGRFQKLNSPPYGMPLVLYVKNDGGALIKSMRFYPIVSDNQLTGYQPHPVDSRQFDEVRRLLIDASRDEHLARDASFGTDQIGPYLELPTK